MANDPKLGLEISVYLQSKGLETPLSYAEDIGKEEFIANCHHDTMKALGLDLTDDSLKDTPKRVSKMYCEEIFYGLDYDKFPACTTFINKTKTFELVAVQGINVLSMCEHHFLPFIGEATIGYLPKDRILGTSKFNRIVDFFSRRPQVQERLTEQIFATLQYILATEHVAVHIKADHFCTKMRGVKASNSTMVTSKIGGLFYDQPNLRNEFLTLTGAKR